MEVTLTEILESRERRVQRQQELLRQYRKPLISFTMNIAGPVKYNDRIQRGFAIGLRDLEQLLRVEHIPCLHRSVSYAPTGCEALLVSDAPAEQLKALTTELEEHSALGRLFDMDVLDVQGKKLSRSTLRRCLLCDEIAQVCARSRAHSVAALWERTDAILQDAILDEDSRFAARAAQQALLYEVGVTPKPGLVDRANNGSHRDMDFFTFQRSTAALYPYFEDCVRIGYATRALPPTETLSRLRFPGKLAEGRMLAATGGVNTHKGAIFSLGILCGALGRLEREAWAQPDIVLSVCGAMAAQLMTDFTSPRSTVGQQLYHEYHITGIRGQAAAGYPAVKLGLQKLEAGLAQGLPLNEAACAALLVLMTAITDTNMIHRGGLQRQQEITAELAALLETTPFPNEAQLRQLDRDFMKENLSPGGSADLLALTLMLWFLKTESC